MNDKTVSIIYIYTYIRSRYCIIYYDILGRWHLLSLSFPIGFLCVISKLISKIRAKGQSGCSPRLHCIMNHAEVVTVTTSKMLQSNDSLRFTTKNILKKT